MLPTSVVHYTVARNLQSFHSIFRAVTEPFEMNEIYSSEFLILVFSLSEIIGALTSVLTIWILTGILVYFAVQRLISNDYELDGMSMLITASCAVIFNIM